MAAPSPALSNASSDTTNTGSAAAPSGSAAATLVANALGNRTDTPPPKTLRGLNKPKCKQCGNVARSRCPYESCKNCCAKAQNPCHIHVLKVNATFPDKAPASSSPLFDKQSTEALPTVNSQRVASFRQLSSTFSQFNNVQVPLRSRKPLTKKDAAAINEWRFSKLKEFKERNIEVENEAFDRYIQNVGLLEEVFSLDTHPDGPAEDESSTFHQNRNSADNDNDADTISGLKSKLRSNPAGMINFRKRIRQTVDRELEKLKRSNELDKRPKMEKDWWDERASTLSDLVDKLNKARNEEDLKSCFELKSQIFNNPTEVRFESKDTELLTDNSAMNDLESTPEISYSFPKLISTAEVDHETLSSVDTHFTSLEKIANL